MTIVIIDYGAGNLKSITNMLDFLHLEYKISSDETDILNADYLIFPGQGHFEQAMNNLKSKNLVSAIKTSIANNIPFLGICLGLQILFEESEEAPNVQGLGILKGKVKKFQTEKIPQIGWNKIAPKRSNLLSEDYFYFVNSYYVEPDDKNIILATSVYEQEFCCAIQKDNLVAVQFHPEKSAENGILFFKKFFKLI